MNESRAPFWLFAAFAIACVMLVTPSRANAATAEISVGETRDGVTLTDLKVQDGAAELALRLRPKDGDTSAEVEVRCCGGELLTSEQKVTDTRSGQVRTAVLVVDSSGSMRQAGILAAREAARLFATKVADDVRIGLIGFDDKARLLTEPTTDRKRLDRGLAKLEPGGETALYDAVRLAAGTAGRGGSVVLLSDGGDTVSRTSLAQAVSAVKQSAATLDVVAFTTDESDVPALDTLAKAGGGRAVAAPDAARLANALADAARSLPTAMSVRAELPASRVAPGSAPTLDVLVRTGSGQVRLAVDLSKFTIPAAPPAPSATPSPAGSAADERAAALSAAAVTVSGPRVPLWIVAVLVFTLLALTVLMLWPRRQGVAERRQRALDVYTRAPGGARSPAGSGGHVVLADGTAAAGSGATGPGGSTLSGAADSLLRMSQRYVATSGREQRIALALDRADLAMKPSEWVVLRCCGVVVGAAMFGLLTRHLIVGGLIGGALAWLAAGFWLKYRQDRRAAAFADQLPDTLQVVASSLRSGFSLNQALAAAHERGIEPMSGELGRALAAARIGAELEDELDAVSVRMKSEDWRWAVMAIRIQRNVGGNLAEILLTTAHTLRERAAMMRHVRALSAEGRLSAYILFALPLFTGGFLLMFRRSYMEPLWTTVPGLGMIVVAVAGLAVGWVWMRKVIEVRI